MFSSYKAQDASKSTASFFVLPKKPFFSIAPQFIPTQIFCNLTFEGYKKAAQNFDANHYNVIEIYLMNEGINVITACDGIEAIEKLKTNKIDLIILDVMMPNLDGIETVKQIKTYITRKEYHGYIRK